jgi:hypothetical protein
MRSVREGPSVLAVRVLPVARVRLLLVDCGHSETNALGRLMPHNSTVSILDRITDSRNRRSASFTFFSNKLSIIFPLAHPNYPISILLIYHQEAAATFRFELNGASVRLCSPRSITIPAAASALCRRAAGAAFRGIAMPQPARAQAPHPSLPDRPPPPAPPGARLIQIKRPVQFIMLYEQFPKPCLVLEWLADLLLVIGEHFLAARKALPFIRQAFIECAERMFDALHTANRMLALSCAP